jgi:hypothetical protein
MHGGKTTHGTNLNGDEKTLPEFEERDAGVVSAGNVSEEMIQEGRSRRIFEIAARIAGSLFIQGHVYAVYIIF